MRSLEPWVGKTDDEPIPARVKLRVFDRCSGRCAHCTNRIGGGLSPHYDHIVALANGGSNNEGNLQVLCRPCHLLKTKGDVAEKSRIYYKRLKAVGISKKRKRTIPGRKFNGDPIPSRWKG